MYILQDNDLFIMIKFNLLLKLANIPFFRSRNQLNSLIKLLWLNVTPFSFMPWMSYKKLLLWRDYYIYYYALESASYISRTNNDSHSEHKLRLPWVSKSSLKDLITFSNIVLAWEMSRKERGDKSIFLQTIR